MVCLAKLTPQCLLRVPQARGRYVLPKRVSSYGGALGLQRRCLRRAAPRRGCQQRPTALDGLPNMGAAATSAATWLSIAAAKGNAFLHSCFEPAVLAATMGVSFKLFLICAAVGWLLKHKKIPESSAAVLSQLSFYLLIPAMLFSKVASTLSTQPPGPLLLTIVAVTLSQICIGAFFGRALAPLVDGQYSRDRTILGWHPLNPAKSAAAIAASVSSASGIPLAAPALLPRAKTPPEGIRQLVSLACAFGNSFTLPAVFFMTLLPPSLADRALGYAAVFMLAWSPMLWSLGYAMVVGGPAGQQQQQQPGEALTSPTAVVYSDPGPGVGGGGGNGGGGEAGGAAQQGAVLTQLPCGAPGSSAGGGLRRVTSGPGWEVVEPVGGPEGIQYPMSDDSTLVGAREMPQQAPGQPVPPPPTQQQQQQRGSLRHPAAIDRLVQYQLLRAAREYAVQVLNPPVLGILAGMALGLTPWGRGLLASLHGGSAAVAGAAGAAGAGVLPPELGLVQGVLRAALEVVELLASGALATQTLVLAASLLKKDESGGGKGGLMGGGDSDALAAGGGGGRSGTLKALRRALLPADGVEERALAVLALVRFLLVPLGTLGLLWVLRTVGALQGIDPVLLFVLLVESVMPSAQNLIILLQLTPRTQRVAPAFTQLLLKQYAYAVVPVTIWVTVFHVRLGIPAA